MEAIVKKVVALMKDIGAIPKNSVNTFHKYKYRSHEDVMNAMQPALIKAGLLLVPVKKTVTLIQPGHVLVEVCYRFTDGTESVDFWGLGEGQDISREGKPGDKAIYKAQTGALKYALNDVLALGTEDDAETDRTTHSEPKPHAQDDKAILDWLAAFDEAATVEQLAETWWKVPKPLQANQTLLTAKNARKAKLTPKGA